jgi:hypothetical protein
MDEVVAYDDKDGQHRFNEDAITMCCSALLLKGE